MHESNITPQVSVEFLVDEIYEKAVVNRRTRKGNTSLGFTFEVATDTKVPAWVVNVVDILPISELSEEDQLRFDQFFDDLETHIRKKFLESTRPITWKVLQAAVDAEIHRENEAA